MIIRGDYGTIFECEEMASGGDLVLVTTEFGSLEVPATDLAMFYLGYMENLNEKPVLITDKASRYIKAAIVAATEHLEIENALLRKELGL